MSQTNQLSIFKLQSGKSPLCILLSMLMGILCQSNLFATEIDDFNYESNAMVRSGIHVLPDEVLLKTLHYLSMDDLDKVSLTCKRLRNIVNDSHWAKTLWNEHKELPTSTSISLDGNSGLKIQHFLTHLSTLDGDRKKEITLLTKKYFNRTTNLTKIVTILAHRSHFMTNDMSNDLRHKMLELLSSLSADQISAISRYYYTRFFRIINNNDDRLSLILALGRLSVNQIKALDTHSSNFFTRYFNFSDHVNTIKDIAQLSVDQINAIADNSAQFFTSAMDYDDRSYLIATLAKLSVDQINGIAADSADIFCDEQDICERVECIRDFAKFLKV